MRKLSILVPSVSSRRSGFLPRSLELLYGQLEFLSQADQDDVEILFLVDNKSMMLGEKRNEMVNLAQGEYVAFVDDDDRVSPDYIKRLLYYCRLGLYDIITFGVEVTINNGVPMKCRYSKEYQEDHNTSYGYFRLPNHICCVRRELAMRAPFPSIPCGEDSAYAKLLKPLLSTEFVIEDTLYYYDYSDQTTESQKDMTITKRRRRDIPAAADVVILSNATDNDSWLMTQKAIDSCIIGANSLNVNVIVIEQNPRYSYTGVEMYTIPGPFCYNKMMNFGAKRGESDLIVFSNNDVVFQNGWLHELIIAGHPVVSPHEPNDYRQQGLTKNEMGTVNGRHLSGWCFAMRREFWRAIGGLDEEFDFWFADDATIKQCVAAGAHPMVVKKSIVYHLGSRTLSTLPPKQRADLMWSKLERYNEKYGDNKFADKKEYLEWKASQ